MISRILSTLLLWSIVGGSLWIFGIHAAVVLITLLAALTLHEFYGLTEKLGCKPFRWLGLLFCVLMMAVPYYATEYFSEYLSIYFEDTILTGLVPSLLAIAVVAFCIGIIVARDNTNRIESLVASLFGLLYVPFMLHFLVRILLLYTDPKMGLGLALWVVAVSKFCDVGALLTGLAIGRHKMSPNISPKKTWEGAVGGVLVSAGLGAALTHFLGGYLPDVLTPLSSAIIGATLGIITIFSDLMESVMKRRADIKDTGKLIPGIGGAFDLTDSLILTAPVAYYIFLFLD